MLQSTTLQRVRHNLVTEQIDNWKNKPQEEKFDLSLILIAMKDHKKFGQKNNKINVIFYNVQTNGSVQDNLRTGMPGNREMISECSENQMNSLWQG